MLHGIDDNCNRPYIEQKIDREVSKSDDKRN
jgi:hypothetical protein